MRCHYTKESKTCQLSRNTRCPNSVKAEDSLNYLRAVFHWAEFSARNDIFFCLLSASRSLNKRKCRSSQKIRSSGKWPLDGTIFSRFGPPSFMSLRQSVFNSGINSCSGTSFYLISANFKILTTIPILRQHNSQISQVSRFYRFLH